MTSSAARSVSSTKSTPTSERTWFGHPPGLSVLFLTEMWERFSYYGMRSLLVLYMLKYLFVQIQSGVPVWGFNGIRSSLEFFYGPLPPQALSSQIYGMYTGLVFFSPLFGGMIADRWLGQRKSVYLGGILMSIGHFMMASESLFFGALLVLILGNGCFKPNVSTQVGSLYPKGDPRRDAAYTIYYMGINLGAFLAPLVCGTLGQKIGWHYGFGAAGVGMLVGLATYHWGRARVPADLLTRKTEAHTTANEPFSKDDWKRVISLIVLMAMNILFWAIYEQQGNTLQLWADQNTDWNLAGFLVPSTWFQAFNPAFIFIFGPLSIRLWMWQNKRGREPSSVVKMGMGCVMCGLGYVIMIIESKVIGPTGQGSVLWLVFSAWLYTMGELYLSPIGLSFVTKISPPRIVSMMMGMWFLANFFGNVLSGYLGSFYETMSKENFFALLTGLGVASGMVFFAARSPIEKLTGKGV